MRHHLFATTAALFTLLSLFGTAHAAETSILTLDVAVQEALAYSPALAGSQSRAKAAEAAKVQAGLLPNPEIGVSAENIMGSGSYGSLDNAEMTYGLTQLIEFPGKRSNRQQVASEELSSMNEATRASFLDIIQSVHIAYAEASVAEALLKVSGEERVLAKSVYESVAAKVEAGKEPPLQAQKAKVAFTGSELGFARAEREFKTAQEQLQHVIGRDAEVLSLDGSFVTQLTTPLPKSEYEAMLNNAPEAKASEVEIRRAEAEVRLEKARRLPDPTINVGVRDFRGTDDQAMVVGVSFPIPVFDRNQAAVEKAGSMLNSAKHDARSTTQQRQIAFIEAYSAFVSAYDTARMIETDILPIASDAASIARQSYDAGKLGYIEVLDAQRTLFDAQREWFAALLEYHRQKAVVERMTGFNEQNSKK